MVATELSASSAANMIRNSLDMIDPPRLLANTPQCPEANHRRWSWQNWVDCRNGRGRVPPASPVGHSSMASAIMDRSYRRRGRNCYERMDSRGLSGGLEGHQSAVAGSDTGRV